MQRERPEGFICSMVGLQAVVVEWEATEEVVSFKVVEYKQLYMEIPQGSEGQIYSVKILSAVDAIKELERI
jgi:hypothetical protein